MKKLLFVSFCVIIGCGNKTIGCPNIPQTQSSKILSGELLVQLEELGRQSRQKKYDRNRNKTVVKKETKIIMSTCVLNEIIPKFNPKFLIEYYI